MLAVGLVVGTLSQAMAVAVPAWRANPLRNAKVRWWSPEVRETCTATVAIALVSSFGVLNFSVDQFMAGLLASGSAAALNFATYLNGVVDQAVVMAASWVIFAAASGTGGCRYVEGLAAQGAREHAWRYALLAIPVAIMIFILAAHGSTRFFSSTVGLTAPRPIRSQRSGLAIPADCAVCDRHGTRAAAQCDAAQ